MQRQILKRQAVVYGSFNFPPIPETSLKLLQLFVADGFMPQMVTTNDPVTGVNSQKVSLARGGEVQIVFNNERIDIVNVFPADDKGMDHFINDVVSYLSRIDGGSLSFSRIALVEDEVLQQLSKAETDALKLELLPRSSAETIEWVARWVTPKTVGTEKFNVNIEAMEAQGLALVVNGAVKIITGVKMMYDIGTSPENLAVRFNINNLTESFKVIQSLINESKSSITLR